MPQPPPLTPHSSHLEPSRVLRREAFRGMGIYVTFGSAIAGIATWFVLGRLAPVVSRVAEDPSDVAPLVRFCLAHEVGLALLALPGVIGGLLLLFQLKPRLRLLWAALGLISMVGLLVLNVLCVVMLLAPLYQLESL